MSLTGAIQIGRSALTASQIGLQVAGNNMANAATPGYTRQTVHLSPMRGQSIGQGQFVGRGVQMDGIKRQVDTALQARLRDAISNEQGATVDQRFLTAIETLQNELTDNDLSSLLSTFFNAWSELGNNPEDNAVRAIVVQQGQNLSNRIASVREDYNVVRTEIDQSIGASITAVEDLLNRVAAINVQIASAESGVGAANALRDQRDGLLDELAEFVDISVIEQASGVTDVFIGSIPVVLAGESRGIKTETESAGNTTSLSVRVGVDGTLLDVQSGKIGALLKQRAETIEPEIASLDTFARELIFQVNRQHAQGQGLQGSTSIEGQYTVDDLSANLNASATNLPFRVENGSVFVHVTHQQTGSRTSHQIIVDGDSMSMNDLLTVINTTVNVPNVTASTGLGGRLSLSADAGYEISFSDDSSGILSALGVNSFFTGSNSSDINISSALEADPTLLSAGAGHIPGSNGTAVAIANLQDTTFTALGNSSLREYWQNSVNSLAVRTAAANDSVSASRLVRESLSAQRQAVAGVSLDEEAINLLSFQRQFQAAARFISVIDETLQTLLSIT